jgi:hypothetical protein
MPFTAAWSVLIGEAEDLPEGATLVTPLSHKRFRITDVQEHRIIIEVEDKDESRPLQREQFETLYHRIDSEPNVQLATSRRGSVIEQR